MTGSEDASSASMPERFWLLEVRDVRAVRPLLGLRARSEDLLAEPVDLGDGAVDVRGRGEDRLDLRPGEATQVLEQLAIERVRGGDDQRPVAPLEQGTA